MVTAESFEDQSLADYAGDTGNYEIEDEANLSFSAHDGTYVLEHPSTGASVDEIFDSNNTYFSKGEEAQVFIRQDGTGWTQSNPEIHFCFGVGAHNDMYHVRLFPESGTCDLEWEYNGNGGNDIINNLNISQGTNGWYEIIIRWDDGTLGVGGDGFIEVEITSPDGTTDSGSGDAEAGDGANLANNTGIAFITNNADGVNTYWDDFGPLSQITSPSSLAVTSTQEEDVYLDVTDQSTVENEFRLYRSTSSGVTSNDTLVDTVQTQDESGTGSTIRFHDESASSATEYFYAATAYDSDGANESGVSNEVSTTTETPTSGSIVESSSSGVIDTGPGSAIDTVPTTTTGGGGGSSSYYDGDTYLLSDYPDTDNDGTGWVDWINAVTPNNGDTLVVDESRFGMADDRTIPEKTRLTTDDTENIYTLQMIEGSDSVRLIRPHSNNVEIDGKLDSNGNRRLIIDGNPANDTLGGGGGLVGSTFWPECTHIRILNIEIINAPANGFGLSNEASSNFTIDDVMIKNCKFASNNAHDIFAGTHPAVDGSVEENTRLDNFLVKDCEFEFDGDQISVTSAGGGGESNPNPPASEHNKKHAFVNNTITNVGNNTDGELLAVEELVREVIVYGNYVDNSADTNNSNALILSKDVDEAFVYQNESIGGEGYSFGTWTEDTYWNNGGAPGMHTECVFAENYSHGGDIGIQLQRNHGNITVTDNKVEDGVNEYNQNDGDDYEIWNNGPDVAGGLPNVLENNLSYTSPGVDTNSTISSTFDGSDEVTASWQESSTDPADGTVQINVTVDPNPTADSIPVESDFTDQGQMFSPGSGWDSFWNDCITPAEMVQLNGDWYCYYIGSEGERSADVGPSRRAVGVVVNTGDPANPNDWSKSSSNPIITHLPNNAEEEGIFTVAAEERGGTVHLFASELTAISETSVNSDIGYYTSTDGVNFTRQSTVLDSSDTSITGYGDELDAQSAYHDGSDWYLYYRASGGVDDNIDRQLCVAWDPDPASLSNSTTTFYNAGTDDNPRELNCGKPVPLGNGNAAFPITIGNLQTENTATVRQQDLSDLTTVGSENNVWSFTNHHISTLQQDDEWLLPIGIYTSGTNIDDVHLYTAPIT